MHMMSQLAGHDLEDTVIYCNCMRGVCPFSFPRGFRRSTGGPLGPRWGPPGSLSGRPGTPEARNGEHAEILEARTVGAHAKKHPASFQGTLGFFISQGFTLESHGLQHHKSVGTLGFQGWVSCGRFRVAELPL